MKNPTRCNSVIKILLYLILNEAQNVSSDTPPIIRSLKLHKQALGLRTWKVRCLATSNNCTSDKPFHVCKTRGCLCSVRLLMMGGVSPETFCASFKIRNNKILIKLLHLVGFSTVRIVLWCTDPRTSSSNVEFSISAGSPGLKKVTSSSQLLQQ